MYESVSGVFRGFFPAPEPGGIEVSLTQIYAVAVSRLGLDRQRFDDLTPLELSLALKDHQDYHFSHVRHQMEMQRLIGVILRNKGLKEVDQIRDARRFWPLWWEKIEPPKPLTKTDWQALDRKYNKKARP